MVTWTRDGDDISSLEDNRYMPSQSVLPNGRLYTAGDYSNILTVSGSLPGMYGVIVTNDRTTTPVTAGPITVRGNIHPIYSGIRLLHIVVFEILAHACMHVCKISSFIFLSKWGSTPYNYSIVMVLGRLVFHGQFIRCEIHSV